MKNDYQRARYVNPYTDFGFKKLFGTEMNKELLISFINSLFNGKEVVKDLTYLNTEHLGGRELDRKAVFDVYCENEKGEKILVEMQKAEQQFFKDRSLYYATFPIREQAERGGLGLLAEGCLRDRHPELQHRRRKRFLFPSRGTADGPAHQRGVL
mgnify:CR=1 FL=1